MSLLFPRAFNAFFPELRAVSRSLNQFEPFLTGAAFPRAFDASVFSDRNVALDYRETENAYEVVAEVPGAKRDDLKLSFSEDGSTLTLSGQIKRTWASHASQIEAPQAGAPATAESSSTDAATAQPAPATDTQVAQAPSQQAEPAWSERFVGSFSRSIRFPHLVDAEATKATLVDGVLSVTVPKRQGSSKTVSIE